MFSVCIASRFEEYKAGSHVCTQAWHGPVLGGDDETGVKCNHGYAGHGACQSGEGAAAAVAAE